MAIKKIGNIEVKSDNDTCHADNLYGLDSVIINPITGQGWQLPLREVTPDDLRELADMMERALAEKSTENLKNEIIKICKQQDKQLFYTCVAKGVETTTKQFDFIYKNHVNDFKKLDLPTVLLKNLLKSGFAIEDVQETFADKTVVTLHFV